MSNAMASPPFSSTQAQSAGGSQPAWRTLLLIGGLYFTQGIPMGLAMEALPVMMRQGGVALDLIAFVPLAGLPWILKLLWAPLVDNHWSSKIGRRRSWVLPMQAILMLSLVAIGMLPLGADYALWLVTALAIGSVASATQDTATDGFAAETLRGSALGYANALQIGGLMAGFLVGGGGALLLSDQFSHRSVMFALAVFPLVTLVVALFWRELPLHGTAGGAAAARLGNSFRRKGVWPLLAVAFLYGGAHAGGVSVTKLFLVDHGWSNGDVGLVAALSGVAMMAIGCPLGARLANRSLWSALGTGILIAAVAFVFWTLLDVASIDVSWISVSIGTVMLAVASGIIAVAAATLAMRFGGAGAQAGTDVTLLQSANVFGEMLIAGLAVWLVSLAGYGSTFLVSALAVFGILAVMRWASRATPSSALGHDEKAA